MFGDESMQSMKTQKFLICLFLGIYLGGYATELNAGSSDPNSFAGQVMLGYQREKEKDYAGALKFYSNALKKREDSATVLVRKAYCSAKLGDFDGAAKTLKQAGESTPVTMTDYTALAWLRATAPFQSLRDGTLAVAYAQKALGEGENAELLDILAAGYAEMGNFVQARNTITRAIKLYPESPRMKEMKERLEKYKKKESYREQWLDRDTKKIDRTLRKIDRESR